MMKSAVVVLFIAVIVLLSVIRADEGFATLISQIDRSTYTSIISHRPVDGWLSGSVQNLTCCNTCPTPKTNVIKNWVTKMVPVNIPVPVLKPHQIIQDSKCPAGYTQHGEFCTHTVSVSDTTSCALGYTRTEDKKCVKTVILRSKTPVNNKCPGGFKLVNKDGGKECVRDETLTVNDNKPIKCPNGFSRKASGHCVQVVECPTKGWKNIGAGACVKSVKKCPKGYKLVGNHKCVPKYLKA
jgi:hypothetical protein